MNKQIDRLTQTDRQAQRNYTLHTGTERRIHTHRQTHTHTDAHTHTHTRARAGSVTHTHMLSVRPSLLSLTPPPP